MSLDLWVFVPVCSSFQVGHTHTHTNIIRLIGGVCAPWTGAFHYQNNKESCNNRPSFCASMCVCVCASVFVTHSSIKRYREKKGAGSKHRRTGLVMCFPQLREWSDDKTWRSSPPPEMKSEECLCCCESCRSLREWKERRVLCYFGLMLFMVHVDRGAGVNRRPANLHIIYMSD